MTQSRLNHTHRISSSSSSSNKLFFLSFAVVVETAAAAVAFVVVGFVMGLAFRFGLFLVVLRPRSKSSQSSNDSGKVTFLLANPTLFGSPAACHNTKLSSVTLPVTEIKENVFLDKETERKKNRLSQPRKRVITYLFSQHNNCKFCCTDNYYHLIKYLHTLKPQTSY